MGHSDLEGFKRTEGQTCKKNHPEFRGNIWRLQVPKSRFALHGLVVYVLLLLLISGLCAFFRSSFTPASTAPFFDSLLVHGLHFTVYAPSKKGPKTGFFLCVCGVAWMIASRELHAPISCILLVMHHQMFQECSPTVPDAGSTSRIAPPTGESNVFSQLGSPWEPWPDAASWQGQESQLSLAFTQGVDAFI